MRDNSGHRVSEILTPAGLLHDVILYGSLGHAALFQSGWMLVGVLATVAFYLLLLSLKRLQRRQYRIERAEYDRQRAARYAAVEAKTTLRRTETEAKKLIESARTPDDIRQLLAEGLLRVPAYAPGECYSRADAGIVAKHVRVFDQALVSELLRQHVAVELSKNSFLTPEVIEPLLWYFAAQYPSIGFGPAVNMGRQAGRDVLKRLIARFGLTAAHPVANKLFCHAVGYSGVPAELRLDKDSGFARWHSVEILKVFPEWPTDWATRLEGARRPPPDPRPARPYSMTGELFESVLLTIVLGPLLVAHYIEIQATVVWRWLSEPFKWLFSAQGRRAVVIVKHRFTRRK